MHKIFPIHHSLGLVFIMLMVFTNLIQAQGVESVEAEAPATSDRIVKEEEPPAKAEKVDTEEQSDSASTNKWVPYNQMEAKTETGDSLASNDSLQSKAGSDSTQKDSAKAVAPQIILKNYKEQAMSLEAGYNSLVGTGFIYHYFVEEHVSIEAGFGGSSDGFTPGVRGRMQFGDDPIPYWGAFGLSYSFGSFLHVPVIDRETRRWPKIRSLPIPRIHFEVGTTIKFGDDFFMLAYVGYSIVMTSETWKAHPDDADLVSEEGAKFFDSFFGSGPSVGVSFGTYPF